MNASAMNEIENLPVLTEVLVPGDADRIAERRAESAKLAAYAKHSSAHNDTAPAGHAHDEIQPDPPSSPSHAFVADDAHSPVTGAVTGPAASEEDWEHLEREVREAVLKGLQGRIDMVLDQRLKETLANLLEQVLAGMTAELKVSLRDTMREVVSRAVAQEISRLQAGRSK